MAEYDRPQGMDLPPLDAKRLQEGLELYRINYSSPVFAPFKGTRFIAVAADRSTHFDLAKADPLELFQTGLDSLLIDFPEMTPWGMKPIVTDPEAKPEEVALTGMLQEGSKTEPGSVSDFLGFMFSRLEKVFNVPDDSGFGLTNLSTAYGRENAVANLNLNEEFTRNFLVVAEFHYSDYITEEHLQTPILQIKAEVVKTRDSEGRQVPLHLNGMVIESLLGTADDEALNFGRRSLAAMFILLN